MRLARVGADCERGSPGWVLAVEAAADGSVTCSSGGLRADSVAGVNSPFRFAIVARLPVSHRRGGGDLLCETARMIAQSRSGQPGALRSI